jgi:5-methyltetrahydropteroyltriglutamate--homocysteine methyltransferase
MSKLLATTVVGSYPQPAWLVDRDRLRGRVPRVRAEDIWRIEAPYLEQAQDDATVLAVRDMERAGIDVITDGEMRRESYSNRFATALSGIDVKNPGKAISRTGREIPVPRIVDKIRHLRPVEVRDVAFLRAHTDRAIKITLPGPFTISQQAQNDFYRDEEEMMMDIAAAVNAEVKALKAAGADVVQLDDPYVQAMPDRARRFAVPAINRALEGVSGPTVVHLCFGYAASRVHTPTGYSFLPELAAAEASHISIEAAQPNLDLSILKSLEGKTIVLGVISIGDPQPETPELVASRIRAALAFVAPERLMPAPDCGMKYIGRELAFSKLQALAKGAAIVRRELENGSRRS